MRTARPVLAFLVALALWFLATRFSGLRFHSLLDGASLVVVAGTTAILAVARFGLRFVGASLATSLGLGRAPWSDSATVGIFLARVALVLLPGVPAVALMVWILPCIDDPTRLGSGLKVAIVSVFHAVALAVGGVASAAMQVAAVPRETSARGVPPCSRRRWLIGAFGLVVVALAAGFLEGVPLERLSWPGLPVTDAFGVIAPTLALLGVAWGPQDLLRMRWEALDLFAHLAPLMGLVTGAARLVVALQNLVDREAFSAGLADAAGSLLLGLGLAGFAAAVGVLGRTGEGRGIRLPGTVGPVLGGAGMLGTVVAAVVVALD